MTVTAANTVTASVVDNMMSRVTSMAAPTQTVRINMHSSTIGQKPMRGVLRAGGGRVSAGSAASGTASSNCALAAAKSIALSSPRACASSRRRMSSRIAVIVPTSFTHVQGDIETGAECGKTGKAGMLVNGAFNMNRVGRVNDAVS